MNGIKPNIMNKSKIKSQKSQIDKPKWNKKGSQINHVGIDRIAITEAPWKGLSAPAKIFYMHLKNEYRPYNNGKVALSYGAMRGVKGCSSNRSISKAIKELESKGWIKIKEIGGTHRHYNLYRLTFKYELYNHDKK